MFSESASYFPTVDVEDAERGVVQDAMNRESKMLEDLIAQKIFLEKLEDADESVHFELQKINRKLKRISKALKTPQNDEIFLGGTFNQNLSVVSTDTEFVTIDNNLKVPQSTWEKLLPYQKVGLEWLYSKHKKSSGGLLGDEMGLGKTVMVSSFLQSLKDSDHFTGPILIICPATLIAQWKKELNIWAPGLGVNEFKTKRQAMIKKIFTYPYGLLLITYEILHKEHKLLRKNKWFYVILDEGHKIKNPEAELTKLCKEFRNFHRLILSGTPIQNSLIELWSLFDFLCPGLLGTLDVFEREFSIPITKAGLAKTNELEIEVGYQCAVQLRNLINPYMLRRTKKDVNIGIPKHTEKILYCELEESQWEVYRDYIEKIIKTTYKDFESFVWIKDLRFICNHPCMLKQDIINKLGFDPEKVDSGKIRVLDTILDLWNNEKQSVLLFSQYKKMLTIAENKVKKLGMTYGRIDGDLEVSKRLPEIDKFNNGEIKVLLLTTKVGGLGINLPKATRVILLDPDWNPMNDSQAKERALRIGQTENIIIYRFLTKGTIEEKIYNRQIFKLFLANKILQCPDQKKFFNGKELWKLFETPPKPENFDIVDTENLPQKRQNDNKLLEMILANNTKDYEEKRILADGDMCRVGELQRMRQHAQDLAKRARDCLLMSHPTSQTTFKVTSGNIGNGKIRDILLANKNSIVKKLVKNKRIEEVIAENLLEGFKNYQGTLTSTQVLKIMEEDLTPFDKFLTRDVLREIATRKGSSWTLKSEFRHLQ